jgi:CheY-like chemotaxis protein
LKAWISEDNYVNLKVVIKFLEKRGYNVVPAENGIEVISKFKNGYYDIILMDIQMPEMDGYETTRIIRKMEEQAGRHTVIIAMTAYAMRGDKEKCISAGMDDYISKPFKSDDLYEIIDEYAGTRKNLNDIDKVKHNNEFQGALDNLYGDEDLMEELIGILVEDYKNILNDIKNSIDNKEYKQASQKAHSLKGTVGNFGADRLRKAICKFEMYIKNEEMNKIGEAFVNIELELEQLVSFLKKWVLNRKNNNIN